jgi:hypothetical protein
MGCGHGLPFPGQTLLHVGFDIAAIVAVETFGLLMAIHAIGVCSFRQQPVLSEVAVIAHIPGSSMTVLTYAQHAVLIFLVIGPGKCQTGDHQEKGSAERHYLHNILCWHGSSPALC